MALHRSIYREQIDKPVWFTAMSKSIYVATTITDTCIGVRSGGGGSSVIIGGVIRVGSIANDQHHQVQAPNDVDIVVFPVQFDVEVFRGVVAWNDDDCFWQLHQQMAPSRPMNCRIVKNSRCLSQTTCNSLELYTNVQTFCRG